MNIPLKNHFFVFYGSSDMIYHANKQKAERYLGGSINDPEVYIVRDVAPNKVLETAFVWSNLSGALSNFKLLALLTLSYVLLFFWT